LGAEKMKKKFKTCMECRHSELMSKKLQLGITLCCKKRITKRTTHTYGTFVEFVDCYKLNKNFDCELFEEKISFLDSIKNWCRKIFKKKLDKEKEIS